IASAVRRVRDSGVTFQAAGRGSLAASARYIGACSSRLVSHSGTSMMPYRMARAFSSTMAWRISQSPVSVIASFAHAQQGPAQARLAELASEQQRGARHPDRVERKRGGKMVPVHLAVEQHA